MSTSEVPENTASASSMTNLRKLFASLVDTEFARTKFERRRVEFCLPPKLRPLFQTLSKQGGRIAVDAEGQELLDFVKNKVYGVLPDYESFATEEQADGFIINDKRLEILMSKKTALRQLEALGRVVDKNTLIAAAEKRLCTSDTPLHQRFTPKDIRELVYTAGSQIPDRQLLACLVKVSRQLN